MRSQGARRKLSATEVRNLRRLLLLNVFEPESIGERIKQARERAGLRQEDLADIIGVATRSVQGYESSSTKPFKHLNAIGTATGVTTEWLLHGDPATGSGEDVGEVSASIDRRLEAIAAAVAQLQEAQAALLAAIQSSQGERAAAQSPQRARPKRTRKAAS